MMMIGITESCSWMTMKISFGRRHVGIINISAAPRCFESCVVLRASNDPFFGGLESQRRPLLGPSPV